MVSTAFQNSKFRTFQDFPGHFPTFFRTLENKFQDISGQNQKKIEIFRTFQDISGQKLLVRFWES
jgi:hypothetical protein